MSFWQIGIEWIERARKVVCFSKACRGAFVQAHETEFQHYPRGEGLGHGMGFLGISLYLAEEIPTATSSIRSS